MSFLAACRGPLEIKAMGEIRKCLLHMRLGMEGMGVIGLGRREARRCHVKNGAKSVFENRQKVWWKFLQAILVLCDVEKSERAAEHDALVVWRQFVVQAVRQDLVLDGVFKGQNRVLAHLGGAGEFGEKDAPSVQSAHFHEKPIGVWRMVLPQLLGMANHGAKHHADAFICE